MFSVQQMRMKSNISGLLFLLHCCSSVLGNESVVVKHYMHVPTPLTWLEAQVHCRSIVSPPAGGDNYAPSWRRF